jgi:hypothetical protein
MQFFNSGFFWFVEGILFVVILLATREWARDRGLPMPPWKWALFVLWLAFVGFTLAFVGTSFGEGEPTAGIRGGLLFGLVSVIGGVGVGRLLLAGSESQGVEVAEGS